MATLYVTEPGARVEQEYGRMVVAHQGEVIFAAPFSRISQVVLVGRVGITTPALHALLREDAGLLVLNTWGKVLGRITPPVGPNLALRRLQYQRSADSEFCLHIAKAVVGGKLRNCRTLSRRRCRSHPQVDGAPLSVVDNCIAKLPAARSLASLRGREGTATRAYFSVFRAILPAGMRFERRVRRPPTDPVNALLSLSYTLLVQNCFTACEVVGLDPYDGFLHSDRYGRPALALDLMEEFRSIIADSVVLNLVNRRMLTQSDFRPGPEGGLFLKPKALRTFFRRYQCRLHTAVRHPLVGRRLTYQKCLEVQARYLRKTIEGELDQYPPFLTK